MADAPVNDILFLAQKLISIPSVTGDIDKAIDVLEIAKDELSGFSFTPFASNGYPSLLYTNTPDTKQFKIILNVHLDVVPGLKTQFKPYVEDGKLYGRGAYDMKAAAAVLILLFKEVAPTLPYPIALQIVTEEEFCTSDGTGHQLKQGIGCDFAIIGESGSNLHIINETKGIVSIEIQVAGTSAHGAHPWKGQNAILKMYEVLNKIQSLFPVPEKETEETTVAITKIATTNNSWNKIPNHCAAVLDIRYSNKDRDTILPTITSLLPTGVTMEIQQARNNHYTDPNCMYIKDLQKVTEQITGKPVLLKKTYAGADTTLFSDAGFDAVQFGPVGYGQHDDNEWVNINSLENYYKILHTFLKSLVK